MHKAYLYLLLVIIIGLSGCRQRTQEPMIVEEQTTVPMSITQRVEATLHNPNYVAVVSHRGDWRNWPENSIPAIESAIAMGVDMVEIDIKRTSDSVLVLCHDWTLDRTTTGSGAVNEYTYEQLQDFDLKRGHGIAIPGLKMPTLRQALEVCKDRVLVNVDQGFDYYEQVLAITMELGMTDQVLIKSGWPLDKVAEVMNRHEEKMLYMPVLTISEQTDTTIFNDYLASAPLAFELCFDTLNDPVKTAAHKVTAIGAKVWVNTLWGSLCGNHDDDRAFADSIPEAIYGPILDLGTNIIQTDRPEFLIQYLEKRNMR